MSGTNLILSVTLGVLAAFAYVPASQAIPINDSTINQDGAVFTIDGEWLNASTYQLTYWANFDDFASGDGNDFLKAIDWKWQGSEVSAVSLVGAPTSLSDWSARAFQQISDGETVGCEKGGGFGAVCTEFVGEGFGLSMAPAGDLSWVFEVSFKNVRQGDLLRGPRVGVVNDGALAAPLGITAVAFPLTEEINGQVPAPGVLSLFLIGLAGLVAGRGSLPARRS
jgi:hypothetical protein